MPSNKTGIIKGIAITNDDVIVTEKGIKLYEVVNGIIKFKKLIIIKKYEFELSGNIFKV